MITEIRGVQQPAQPRLLFAVDLTPREGAEKMARREHGFNVGCLLRSAAKRLELHRYVPTVRLPDSWASRAAITVLASSIVIVIGPTPPGTGVIAPATSLTLAKSTSPTSLLSTRVVPTSITTAPGLTISALTNW